MKVGIMQPYFFPYLGYYSLIKSTDQFILFDTVQFIRHGWIERNRVLKPVEGWQYIAVPLEKKSLTTPISETKIRNMENWRDKINRQLEHYKKRAPHYHATIEIINSAIDIDTDSIVVMNANILAKTCEYIGIPLKLKIFSEMGLNIGNELGAGEWALYISKAISASEYVNPMGGRDIFRPDQFKAEGITLSFIENNLHQYSQRRPSFESGLSIIDVMMFNDVPQIIQLIDDVNLTTI